MRRTMTYENNIDTHQEINARDGLLGSLDVRMACRLSSAPSSPFCMRSHGSCTRSNTEQNRLDSGNTVRGSQISHANRTLSTLGNVTHISQDPSNYNMKKRDSYPLIVNCAAWPRTDAYEWVWPCILHGHPVRSTELHLLSWSNGQVFE
jgi:hypothetical protein